MNNFIIQKIHYWALKTPNRFAIQDSTSQITYGQLWERITETSNVISKYVQGKHIPVIVYQERGINFIIAMLSVLKANCCYIPIIKKTNKNRIQKIIEDSNCKFAIVDEKIESSKLVQYNIIDEGFYNKHLEEINCISINEYEDIAYVMYTSGSTGLPKGVKISLENLKNLVESFWEILYKEIIGAVKVAVIASFGFDSSVKQIYCSLYYGHTLVIASDKEKMFSRNLQEFYINNNIFISDGTPSNLKILLLTRKKICNNVKYYIIGGENFSSDVARKMFEKHENNINIINVYGPTECCVDVSYYKVDKKNIKDGFLPIGRPILNTEILICDENRNIIKMPNIKGELVIIGQAVGKGYTNADNSCFEFGTNISDNRYYTGDLAIYDRYHNILITGRKDNQIKKNGYRIELNEIASYITYNKDILDVAVRKIDINGIEKIVAYIVSNKNIDSNKIRNDLSLRIPKYMIPDIFLNIDKIPININSKVDEEKLKSYVKKYI